MSHALRPDLAVIASLIAPGSRVLDIGCGNGELLHWLHANKQVDGRGIEIDQEQVYKAIARGIPVIQGDVTSDLLHYPDKGYDFVVLSQTLQTMQHPHAVLEQLVRIGKQAIVSVPNFGYWKNRMQLLVTGKMPVNKTLSYEWYDTPNIHFCTITDFVVLAERLGIEIEDRVVVDGRGEKARFTGYGFKANLFGQQGVFLLKSKA